MRTIIAGCSAVTEYREVFAAMMAYPFAVSEVVSVGVAALEEEWAEDHGMYMRRFDVGEERQMVAYADALVAVRCGEGVDVLIQEAQKNGLKVFVYRVDREKCNFGTESNPIKFLDDCLRLKSTVAQLPTA